MFRYAHRGAKIEFSSGEISQTPHPLYERGVHPFVLSLPPLPSALTRRLMRLIAVPRFSKPATGLGQELWSSSGRLNQTVTSRKKCFQLKRSNKFRGGFQTGLLGCIEPLLDRLISFSEKLWTIAYVCNKVIVDTSPPPPPHPPPPSNELKTLIKKS